MTGAPAPPAGATDVLHVDMDAFFAAVEVLDDPSLSGTPLIVGGPGGRGVVASCSYEARAYGVRSAMPSTEARRLCPDAVFVPGRHNRYSAVSSALHEIFGDFTPIVEGIALDEAFLDVSGAHRLHGTSFEIAQAIRARVSGDVGLSCSVGVARTKLLAKLASRAAKPRPDRSGAIAGRGVAVVAPDAEMAFLHPLPVRALWGVGPRTAERLRRYGVSTVGDLAAVGRASLERLLGAAQGALLHELAQGHDERPVVAHRELKSVGHEETFAVDDRDRGSLHRQAVRMSDSVAARMREAGVTGRTVTLKVRFADFATITRARTLPIPTASGREVAKVAALLLEAVEVGKGVRLLGVSVSGLATADAALAEQLSFADSWSYGDLAGSGDRRPGARDGPGASPRRPTPDADRGIDDAVDAVRRRFGAGAVGPASITGPDGLEVKRRGDSQWGPSGGVTSPGPGPPSGA